MSTFVLQHYSAREAQQRYKLPTDRNLFKARTPVINTGNPAALTEQIRQYFHDTYDLYEKVFECLASPEAFTVPPVHKLRHPMIFYYGHTACFYINKLAVAGLTERINPKFEEMFAIGVDEMSWDDLNEAHYDWPAVEKVTEYRRLVRDRVDSLITSGKFPLHLPLTFSDSTANDSNAFWWVILMGCEHERIHIETASVHVRELPLRFVRPEMAKFWDACPENNDPAPINSLITVDGGKVILGRQKDSPMYGWDCDYSDGLEVHVKPFRASKMLVSNAEFYEFVKAGGYTTRHYWDEEGWQWVSWKKPQHPWFWVEDKSNEWGYKLRLQTELIDIPWDWPVEVNHLEAKAFCRFLSEKHEKTVRLPTEAEWTLLYDRYVKKDQHQWEKEPPGNLNLELYRSSCPVNKYSQGPFFDIVGNTWQHTENAVYPYQGFKVQPFYDDFSMPTFDGRHACMKGGAWISTGNEATRDARFAFRRHFFQFIGIRYVESEAEPEPADLTPGKAVLVGMDPEVEATTHFAYHKGVCGHDNAAVHVAEYAKEVFSQCANNVQPRRALDLFCGAGRITFELTTQFAEVIGSDFTARKLIPAFAMKERGSTAYAVCSRPQGPEVRVDVRGNDFAWSATRDQAFFFQADPSNLHAHMKDFDLIVAFNVLENTHRPEDVPLHLLSRLNKGGILVIASSFDWQPICGKEHRPTIPLFANKTEPAGVLQEMLTKGGAATVVREPSTFTALYPTSMQSGSLATITIMSFRKN